MATHYKETFPHDGAQEGRRGACLARGCECRTYQDALAPEPPKVAPPLINGIMPDSTPTDPPSSAPATLPPITWPNWP